MKMMIILSLMLVSAGCNAPVRSGDAGTSSVTSLVANIRPDMPTTELTRLFGVEGKMGPWSGGTGYFDYPLPSGQRISVACYSQDGLKHVFVHPDITVFVQEKPGQQPKRIR